jgi:predicted transcriptional regulator
MDAADLRKRLTQSLLDEINDVQFPSVTMMNRVESTLATQDDLADYIEVLVKKVEATRFPSISMLNRLDGLLDQLDQVEQRQQLEAAQSDGGGGG